VKKLLKFLEFSKCKYIFIKYVFFKKKMKLGPQLMWGLLTNNSHQKFERRERERKRERGGWGEGWGGEFGMGWGEGATN